MTLSETLQLKQVMTHMTIKPEDIDWGAPILLKAMEIKERQKQVQRELEQQYIEGAEPSLFNLQYNLDRSGETGLSKDLEDDINFISYKAFNMSHDYRPVLTKNKRVV